MSHHVAVRLPDGRHAVAGHTDPVAADMRRINREIALGKTPPPGLYAPVTAWLDGHREQSAACHAWIYGPGLPCGHD